MHNVRLLANSLDPATIVFDCLEKPLSRYTVASGYAYIVSVCVCLSGPLEFQSVAGPPFAFVYLGYWDLHGPDMDIFIYALQNFPSIALGPIHLVALFLGVADPFPTA